MRDSARAEQITATIISTARRCNLDKDVKLPQEEDKLTVDERDLVRAIGGRGLGVRGPGGGVRGYGGGAYAGGTS